LKISIIFAVETLAASIKQGFPVEKYMHASLSTEKLCSILSYLGQVEESNQLNGCQEPMVKKENPCICYSPRENGSPRTVLEQAEDTMSHTSSSQTAHSSPPAISGDSNSSSTVAVSVFEGVRKKVQELKQKISAHEARIAELKAENEELLQEKQNCVHRYSFNISITVCALFLQKSGKEHSAKHFSRDC
jgi:hypothetical protein